MVLSWGLLSAVLGVGAGPGPAGSRSAEPKTAEPKSTEPRPAEPRSAEPTAPAPASEPVHHAIVLDEAIDPGAGLPEELALRLGDRTIVSARTASGAPEGSYVWVEVDAVGPTAVQIRLIVSDGRLFSRTIEAAEDQHARIVAGSVANMIDAIEGNRLAPERTGVTVPRPEPAADPPPASEDPGSDEPPDPSPSDPAPGSADAEPGAWLGVVLGGAGSFGLGAPTAVAGPTGFGGSLGAQLVHRSGAVAGLDLRATGWRRAGVSLTRLRVSATAGYAWRPGRFELLGAIGPTVEATLVDAELFTPSGTRQDTAPLVGGRLLVRPTYTVAEPGRLRVLVGAELDAAFAVEARAPPGAIQIHRQTSDGFDPIARAGGFELAAALVVELRFALGLTRS